MNNLFEKLISAFGVSGREEEVREVIIEELNSLGVSYRIDKMGNIIVTLGDEKEEEERLMLCSHMDTNGLIVTYIEEKGFLRVGKMGDFKESSIINTVVEFENGNCGRVCTSNITGNIDEFYIDLGVSNRDEALELVKEGDVAVISSNIIEEEKNIIAPYLDNRVGCYILLDTIKKLREFKELKKQLFFVFSTQNVVGGRGARAAAYSIKPMYCLVIDGEESEDSLGGKDKFSLGKGSGIKFMDRTLISHHEVKEMLEDVYMKLGKKPRYIFGEEHSDGKTIHKEGNGIKTCTLVYPVRYKNTSMEMVSYKDIEETIDIVSEFCKL